MIVKNFLTLDVEEWFDAEIMKRRLIGVPEESSDLENQIDLFLSICDSFSIKSTCFIAGKLAEKKPKMIIKMHEAGHEIASHSYAHKLIYSMNKNDFREDLIRSVGILQEITGVKVKGFRAPSWSVNAEVADWFYDVLQETGLLYSSSVYPAKTFLFGYPSAPEQIHLGGSTEVYEIPQQILNLKLIKTGVTGGAFLRMLPAWFIIKFIKGRNKRKRSVFIYLHPWELIHCRYPVKLSIAESLVQYYGISFNKRKIKRICTACQETLVRMDHFIEGEIKKKLTGVS